MQGAAITPIMTTKNTVNRLLRERVTGHLREWRWLGPPSPGTISPSGGSRANGRDHARLDCLESPRGIHSGVRSTIVNEVAYAKNCRRRDPDHLLVHGRSCNRRTIRECHESIRAW